MRLRVSVGDSFSDACGCGFSICVLPVLVNGDWCGAWESGGLDGWFSNSRVGDFKIIFLIILYKYIS